MSNGDFGREARTRMSSSDGSGESALKLMAGMHSDDLETRAGEPQRDEAGWPQGMLDVVAQEERHWLARALHDSVSPVLYSIGLLASTALRDLPKDPDRVRLSLNLMLEFSQRELAEMRQLMTYIHAASLVEALSETIAFAQYEGVQVEAELCPEPPLDDGTKLALYMIAQEAVHNATKYAPSGRLMLRLERQDGRLVLDVSDDGPGFDPADVSSDKFGLTAMRERAALLGGTLEINSASGAGTRVRVAVPVIQGPEGRVVVNLGRMGRL